MKVHMLSETVAFRPYDFLIDVSSGPWDYGLPGSARCIDCLLLISICGNCRTVVAVRSADCR
ncbi:hypothetical protein HMPREF3193_00639 [Bifidobacterium breve]|nr:hypothetical protein HMPREF3193_00639 [Bifidobacterium breve]